MSYLPAWTLIAFMAVMPLEGLAQTAKRVPRIAMIASVVPLDQMERDPSVLVFRSELIRLGWTPGRNVEIFWRSLEGAPSRAAEILDDLRRLEVDAIVLNDVWIAREAQRKSRSVAIVMAGAIDPVGAGLVSELGRPGGNITGVVVESDAAIYGKRMGLFREILPKLRRLAYFSWDHPARNMPLRHEMEVAVERMAHELGITLIRYRVQRAEEVEAALADAKGKSVDGAYFDGSSPFYNPRAQGLINGYAEKIRMPVMHSYLSGVETGGLIAYGLRQNAAFEKVAQFVDRILRGAKPGDLPFEQVGNYFLYVNAKTAKAIGLTIPFSILAQADKIIE